MVGPGKEPNGNGALPVGISLCPSISALSWPVSVPQPIRPGTLWGGGTAQKASAFQKREERSTKLHRSGGNSHRYQGCKRPVGSLLPLSLLRSLFDEGTAAGNPQMLAGSC